jgi:hypothetical protein
LKNNYVPVDPRAWNTQFDCTVNVGLGAGNKQEQLAMLQAIAMAQQAAVQGGGMGTLITPKNLYNLQAKVAVLAGFKDPAAFWTDPGDEFQPPPEKEPELVQAEKVRAGASLEKAQVDGNVEMQKAQVDAGVERQKALISAAVQLLIAGAKQESEDKKLLLDSEVGEKRLAHDREMGEMRMTGKPKPKKGEPSPEDIAAFRHQETVGAIMRGMQELVASMSAPKNKELVRDGSGKLVGVRQV